MMAQTPILSIAILLLLPIILHANPALTTITGLESNIITLTNSNQSDSQLYISSLTIPFTTIPRIALAITGLSGSNSNSDSSFHITTQTITKSSFIVSWQRNIQKWQRVDLKFMASTRDDLLLGTSQTTFNGESNKIKINMEEITNFNASILRTFLLGCDTASSSMKCGLLPAGVAQNFINIEVENMAVNSKISFSYVIFAPSRAKFTSYGGLVNKEAFKGTLNAKVFKTVAYTDHKFHGLSYLKLTGEIPSNFNSKIDSEFAFSLNSQQLINTLSIFYIVIGRTAKSSCPDQDFALQFKTQCLATCPDNTYVFPFSDGGKSCQSCSQVFNQTLSDGKCVLINKATQTNPQKTSQSMNNLVPLFKQAENKQIKTISQSSIVQDRSSQQIVQQGFVSQQSSNQQQSTQETLSNIIDQSSSNIIDQSTSSTYSPSTSSNTPIITSSSSSIQPQNQQSYTQTNDNSGSYSIQASATSSPVMITPQNIQNPTCGSNEFFLNGICVCQVGYQRVGGICITFSSQSQQIVLETKVTDKNSNINTPIFNSPSTTTVFCGEGYDNGFGVCVCPNGMRYDLGRCLPIQQFQQQQLPQPEQQQPQQLNYQPQLENPKGEASIQCGRNQRFDKDKYSCLCKKGFGRLNGACVICPDKMTINEIGFCVEDYREKKQDIKIQTAQNGNKIKEDSSNVKDQQSSSSNCSIPLQKGQKQLQNIAANTTNLTQSQTVKQQKTPSPQKTDDNKIPSTLTRNPNNIIKPSSDDIKTQENLKLSGSIKGNNKQIFMTLDSITPFDFPDQQTMSNFIKGKFTGCSSPTLYCNQQAKTKNLFDCLLIFPSGVPNKSFTAQYSYSYQGKEGNTKIPVDPFKIQLSNSRSNSRASSNIRAV